VFHARYELNSYIVFRKRLVSKRLICANILEPIPKHVSSHLSSSSLSLSGTSTESNMLSSTDTPRARDSCIRATTSASCSSFDLGC
jgi:hypothetical protein